MKQEFLSEFVFKKERKDSNILAIDTQNNSGYSERQRSFWVHVEVTTFMTIQVKASTGPTSLQADSVKHNIKTTVYS